MSGKDIQSGHRVVFQANAGFPVHRAAVADGGGDHHGRPALGDQTVEGRKQGPVGTVRADDERRCRARDVLFGSINRYPASVGTGMAGGDHQLGGVVGVRRAKGIGLAGDAGIDLAVGRFHGEVVDGSRGTPSCAVISGAGLCAGPRMKFPSSFTGALAPSGRSFAFT